MTAGQHRTSGAVSSHRRLHVAWRDCRPSPVAWARRRGRSACSGSWSTERRTDERLATADPRSPAAERREPSGADSFRWSSDRPRPPRTHCSSARACSICGLRSLSAACCFWLIDLKKRTSSASRSSWNWSSVRPLVEQRTEMVERSWSSIGTAGANRLAISSAMSASSGRQATLGALQNLHEGDGFLPRQEEHRMCPQSVSTKPTWISASATSRWHAEQLKRARSRALSVIARAREASRRRASRRQASAACAQRADRGTRQYTCAQTQKRTSVDDRKRAIDREQCQSDSLAVTRRSRCRGRAVQGQGRSSTGRRAGSGGTCPTDAPRCCSRSDDARPHNIGVLAPK